MSSFDTTPLSVYLIIVFSIALIAVVFAIAVAGYEFARHRRSMSGAGDPSGVAGSIFPASHRRASGRPCRSAD